MHSFLQELISMSAFPVWELRIRSRGREWRLRDECYFSEDVDGLMLCVMLMEASALCNLIISLREVGVLILSGRHDNFSVFGVGLGYEVFLIFEWDEELKGLLFWKKVMVFCVRNRR